MAQHDGECAVVTPYDLAEKSEKFSCKELKEELNYFKNDQDREQLVKAITEGLLKGCLSRDAALVCAGFHRFETLL